MGKIILEKMEFYAYHGFYSEENKIGCKYSIDLEIETDLSLAGKSDMLTETINYEVLYKIVSDEMKTPSKLIEHVAERILSKIRENFVSVKSGQIRLSKINPPLGGNIDRVSVVLEF